MNLNNNLEPSDIVDTLGMAPHPEGGWYVQTFRDSKGGVRGHSTAIYYLLEEGQRSHWHRVIDATEVWLWHGGAPMELSISKDGKSTQILQLGLDLKNGERPQAIVEANEWQSAKPLGKWALVSCTVAPGFEFGKFEMAAPNWEPSQE